MVEEIFEERLVPLLFICTIFLIIMLILQVLHVVFNCLTIRAIFWEDKKEIERFLKTVQNLRKLKSGQLDRLNLIVKKSKIKRNLKKGIF